MKMLRLQGSFAIGQSTSSESQISDNEKLLAKIEQHLRKNPKIDVKDMCSNSNSPKSSEVQMVLKDEIKKMIEKALIRAATNQESSPEQKLEPS